MLCSTATTTCREGCGLAFALYGTSLAVVRPWFAGGISHLPGPVRAMQVTWSLSIEEFFYLLWAPAVRFLKERYLFALVVAIIVMAPLVRWYIHVPGGEAEYYFLPARMDTLAFGALLALWRTSGRPSRVPGLWLTMSLLVTASVLILTNDPQKNEWFAIFGYTLIALTMSLLVAFVLNESGSRNLLCRALRSRVLVRVGTVSYMFYLLHLFVIRMYRDWFPALLPTHRVLERILQLGVSLFTTLFLAELSWRYFETPILRLKSRFEPALTNVRKTSAPGREDLEEARVEAVE